MKDLTPEEKEIIQTSLIIRKNLIETGDKSLSKEDAIQRKLKIKELDTDQIQLVNKIKHLIRSIQE